MLEILPSPVSVDRVLALVAPSAARGEDSTSYVDPSLEDATIGGVSHNDSLPHTSEDETMKEVLAGGNRVTIRRRITWMDSHLVGMPVPKPLVRAFTRSVTLTF